MPKVSINILTKNRASLLRRALASVEEQSFKDFEVIVVNDGSTDNTEEILSEISKQFSNQNFEVIKHKEPVGITKSRQEALEASGGEYVAILDDDDEWIDVDKLAKQIKFFDENPETVLVGGRIKIELRSTSLPSGWSREATGRRENQEVRIRPEIDQKIRKTMLFRNNFFTSTVMFRRKLAIRAGGFIKDGIDLAEDYDLWLRMGKFGEMYNFREAFTLYAKSGYNKEKFKRFITKQLKLIDHHKYDYPGYWLAKIILKLRLWF